MLALGTTPLLCRPRADLRGHVGFYVLPFNRQVDPQRTYSRIRHNSTQNSPLRSVQARGRQARGDACRRVWAAGIAVVGVYPGFTRTEAVVAAVAAAKMKPPPLAHSPEYMGRAVAHFAADPEVLAPAARDSKSPRWPVGIGSSTWTAELRAVSHVRGEPSAGRRPSSQAARTMEEGPSLCGPKARLARRAADGQQSTAVGTDTTVGEAWQIVGGLEHWHLRSAAAFR
jgi:hypothetical protein